MINNQISLSIFSNVHIFSIMSDYLLSKMEGISVVSVFWNELSRKPRKLWCLMIGGGCKFLILPMLSIHIGINNKKVPVKIQRSSHDDFSSLFITYFSKFSKIISKNISKILKIIYKIDFNVKIQFLCIFEKNVWKYLKFNSRLNWLFKMVVVKAEWSPNNISKSTVTAQF